MATKLMVVRGMTCTSCERQVEDALIRSGASGVRADFRRGEVVFDPGQTSEAQLNRAVGALGYEVATVESLPEGTAAAPASRSDRWPLFVLVLPVVCCGAPLIVAVIASLSVGAWLAANRVFVVSGLAVAGAAIGAGLWLLRRGGLRG